MKKRMQVVTALLIAALLTGCGQINDQLGNPGYEPDHSADTSAPRDPGYESDHPADTSAPQDPGIPAIPAEAKTKEELYELMLAGIAEHQPVISGLGNDRDMLTSVMLYIAADHPELFWFRGRGTREAVMQGDVVVDVTFTPEYCFTEEEAASYQTQLEEATAPVIAHLSGKSDYEKVKGVYEYVIDTITYGGSPRDDCDAVAGLVHHTGVCSAYAASVQYLLQQLGMECMNISGADVEDTFNHAWNAVKVEGEWYYVDATSGDMSTDVGANIILYDYLLITTEQMEREFVTFDGQRAPECTATAWNYHRVEGLYMEKYSYDAFLPLFQSRITAEDGFTIRFGSQAEYDNAMEDLAGANKHLSDAYFKTAGWKNLPESSQLRFLRGAGQYTLRVFFI